MSVRVREFSESINESDFLESMPGAREFRQSTHPDFLKSMQDGEETGCSPEFFQSIKAGEGDANYLRNRRAQAVVPNPTETGIVLRNSLDCSTGKSRALTCFSPEEEPATQGLHRGLLNLGNSLDVLTLPIPFYRL